MLAPQDARLAATLEGLGRSLEMLDRFAEAVGPYRRALAIREQANGAGSDAAAEDITRLAIVLMRLDRPADAEPLFRRMLAMREAAQGADGEGVAEALRWIANAAERQDRNAEAEILHKRALAISEKTIWARRLVDRPRPLVAGASVCGAATRRGGRTVAGACCRHSGSRPPSGSESAVAARIALAFLKFSSGAREEAVALTERSLADISAVKGADHPDAAGLMVTLAQMRLELSAYAEAERLAVAAQAIYSSKAPESRQLIRTRTILGSVRLAQGRTREAIDLYSEVLAALQQRFGADSGQIQSALADIGRAHFVASHFDKGRARWQKRAQALTARGPANSQMMKPSTGRSRISTVHSTLAPVDAVLPNTLTIAQMSAISTSRPKKPPTLFPSGSSPAPVRLRIHRAPSGIIQTRVTCRCPGASRVG